LNLPERQSQLRPRWFDFLHRQRAIDTHFLIRRAAFKRGQSKDLSLQRKHGVVERQLAGFGCESRRFGNADTRLQFPYDVDGVLS